MNPLLYRRHGSMVGAWYDVTLPPPIYPGFHETDAPSGTTTANTGSIHLTTPMPMTSVNTGAMQLGGNQAAAPLPAASPTTPNKIEIAAAVGILVAVLYFSGALRGL